MADIASGRAGQTSGSGKATKVLDDPAEIRKPTRAKRKAELNAITDTIIERVPVTDAPAQHEDSVPVVPDEEPAALDEVVLLPNGSSEGAEADVDALAAVGIEDGIGEDVIDGDVVDADALEADIAVVPDEGEEEEDDGPPVSNRVAPRMPGHMPGVPNRPIMHARMPAKAEIFHEGDHVVYPTHGVGKVERIATEEIAGHRLELIHITFEENRMTLRVPVSKARSAGLRKLATRKMFDDAMAVLKGRARIKRTMWSRRAQEYEAKINSGDPIAIAEVVRDLHRNAGQPDQSFSERQIYEAAMDRLAAELAALDKTDKPTAVTKLADFLKTV